MMHSRKCLRLLMGVEFEFAKSEPARHPSAGPKERFDLHLDFIPRPKTRELRRSRLSAPVPAESRDEREAVRKTQINEIVTLIHSHLDQMEVARSVGNKYRVAVLGRARTALRPSRLLCAKPEFHFAPSNWKT